MTTTTNTDSTTPAPVTPNEPNWAAMASRVKLDANPPATPTASPTPTAKPTKKRHHNGRRKLDEFETERLGFVAAYRGRLASVNIVGSDRIARPLTEGELQLVLAPITDAISDNKALEVLWLIDRVRLAVDGYYIWSDVSQNPRPRRS